MVNCHASYIVHQLCLCQIPPDQLRLPEQETARKNSKSKEHKEMPLVDGSPEKTALIGANVDPKSLGF